jgi:hypothetical protein
VNIDKLISIPLYFEFNIFSINTRAWLRVTLGVAGGQGGSQASWWCCGWPWEAAGGHGGLIFKMSVAFRLYCKNIFTVSSCYFCKPIFYETFSLTVGSVGVGSVGGVSVGVGSVGVESVGFGSVGVGSVGLGSVGVGSVGVGSVEVGSVGVGSVAKTVYVIGLAPKYETHIIVIPLRSFRN